MHIAVALRLMPNPGDELEIDENGADIDREFVDMVLNEFDDQALEEAVLLKEATGATVTAVGLQADGIEQALRVAYARGADRVVVVEPVSSIRTTPGAAPGPLPRRSASLPPTSCSPACRRRPTCSARRRPYLAAALGWPQANVVVGVTLDGCDRPCHSGVRRRPDGGPGAGAAGGGRRPVGELPASLRVDGTPAPGDDRGQHRDHERQRSKLRRMAPRSSRWRGPSRPRARRCSTVMPNRSRRRSSRCYETRECGELMGDVLVYLEPSGRFNERLLGCARPLADATGGPLVGTTRHGSRPVAGSARPPPTWCSRSPTPRSRRICPRHTRRCSPRRSRRASRISSCWRTRPRAMTSPLPRRRRRIFLSSATAWACRSPAARRKAPAPSTAASCRPPRARRYRR